MRIASAIESLRPKAARKASEKDPATLQIFDTVVFERICHAAEVAASGDGGRFAEAAFQAFGKTDRQARLTSLYINYLVHHRLWQTVGGQPTVAKLWGVARTVYPAYAKVIVTGISGLEQALWFYSEVAPEGLPVAYKAEMAPCGLAILGVLSEDVEGDLLRVLPRLRTWCENEGDALAAMLLAAEAIGAT